MNLVWWNVYPWGGVAQEQHKRHKGTHAVVLVWAG